MTVPAFVELFADPGRETSLGFVSVQSVVGEVRRRGKVLLVIRRQGATDRQAFTDRRGLNAARVWLRASAPT